MKLSIVIPIYNEIDNIPTLCERLYGVLGTLGLTHEVILVDDGSTDGSWAKLLEQSARYPHLVLIRLRGNFGQTAAMSAGFENATGDVIITLDADLQNDPADIPMLLKKLDEGFDVVSGWRRDRKDAFINRRLPSMLANGLISRITGVPLHDYGCTLKAYRREVIRDVRLYGQMHRFIPALANWVGARIGEVVVQHHPRRFGTSKYGISRTLRVVLDLMTVKFLLRYSTGPMEIFGKLAGMFGLPGVLMLAAMIGGNLSHHLFDTELASDLVKRPFWVMGSFMFIYFGIQFICMGLLAEIQIRAWHESQNKQIYVIRETVRSTAAPGAAS